MEIARERFLDDTRSHHVTLSLRSRTNEMHSALSSLTHEERDAVALALARALDEIGRIVAPHVPSSATAK
jgi:truncated hemoglobin YjbI